METWSSPAFGQKLRKALMRRQWFFMLPEHARDEVIQETLEALLRAERLRAPAAGRSGRPRPIADPLAYAIVTARNRAFSLWRRSDVPLDAGDADRLPFASANPEERAIDAERMCAVVEAVERLPAGQQAVVRLVLEDGLLVQEVAQQLGITIDSVYKRLSRGLRALRTELASPKKAVRKGRRARP
ncbi:MAG: sigma-70 family RNA polymerase sigma factor [Deltaproteobacteria bacterium]|nr:sigma-70 family RNA polymerase sigma factor [Deltaproteobacteria bacterium]